MGVAVWVIYNTMPFYVRIWVLGHFVWRGFIINSTPDFFSNVFIFILCALMCMSVWGCWVPWNWSYRQLWAAMWMLGIELRSSGRAVNECSLPLNCTARLYYVTVQHYSCIAAPALQDHSQAGQGPGDLNTRDRGPWNKNALFIGFQSQYIYMDP